jgi:hypothetical protein
MGELNLPSTYNGTVHSFPYQSEVPFIPPGDLRDELHYYQPPAFTLETFVGECAVIVKLPIPKVRQAIVSRHNYKKMTKLSAERHIIRSNTEMHLKE